MLEIVLVVLPVLVLGVVAVIAVNALRFRAMRTRHRARIATVEPHHSEPASLVGLASEGRLQARGVGTLAVGQSELIFVQLVPEREIVVPRESITSTRATRHFLGKTTGSDLLVVTWDVQGLTDAAAFAVPDVEAWRDHLA